MAFNKYGSLNVSMVNQLDGMFGFEIPSDYKEFLIKTNGGRFDYEDEHYIMIKNKKIWVDVLYGNKQNMRSSLLFWNNEYGDEIPQNSIIIGDTQDHNFLVYVCVGEKKGIYLWDDTLSIEGSSCEEKNAYFIASDMNELFDKFKVQTKVFSLDVRVSNIDEKIGESNVLYKSSNSNRLQAIDAIAFKKFMHPCDMFII